MLKVSIVVPVYNVEQFLPSCLDTIRAQTYKNIEIICVDDGSTDRSSLLLSMYREADDRLVVVHKSNGGLSSARNAGINAASGDVVWFVDSDDMIAINACARLVEAFEQTQADIVVFGGEAFPAHRVADWLTATLSPRDAFFDRFDPEMLTSEAVQPFVWRSAYKLDFIKGSGLRFDEDIRYGEDKVFQYIAYPRAKSIALIHDKLYRYRVGREGSLMSLRGDNDVLKLYDHIRIVDAISRDWKAGGLIEEHGFALLCQMAEFVLRDAMNAPYGERTMLLNFLQAVFTSYYTADQLNKLMSDAELGPYARALLIDRPQAFKNKIRLASSLRGLLSSFPPVRWVVDSVRRFLPMSATKQHERLLELTSQIKDAEWEAHESHMLADSLSLLDMELKSTSAQ